MAGLLLGLFVILKIPTLSVTFFWDEILVYALPAQGVYESGFRLLIDRYHANPDFFFGRPPAYATSIAVWYGLIEAAPWVARAFSLLLASLGLAFAYAVVRKCSGERAGIVALVALATNPNFFVQSTHVLADVALMGLIPITFYFFLNRQWILYAVVSSYLVLSKETALAAVVAFPLAKWLCAPPASRKELLCSLAPIFSLGLFFLTEKILTGRFSNWPQMEHNSAASAQEYITNLILHFDFAFLNRPERLVLLIAAAVGGLNWMIRAFQSHSQTDSAHNNFISASGRETVFAQVLTILFFSIGKALISEANEHYFIPNSFSLVAISVILAWPILARFYLWIFLTGAFVYFLNISNFKTDYFTHAEIYEGRLNYIDAVAVRDEAIEFLSENFPDATIHAVWPVIETLVNPIVGNKHQPFEATHRPDDDKFDILFLADASGKAGYLQQKHMIENQNLILFKTFERNGQFVRLYKNPRSKIRGGDAPQ